MQTFITDSSITPTMRALDTQRLGKQRVEAMQIHQILISRDYSKGWGSHPAVKMWAGFDRWLAVYGMRACQEFRNRGYTDNLLDYFQSYHSDDQYKDVPPWWHDDRIHMSHKRNLVCKDYNFYSPIFNVRPSMTYFWPTQSREYFFDGSRCVRWSDHVARL